MVIKVEKSCERVDTVESYSQSSKFHHINAASYIHLKWYLNFHKVVLKVEKSCERVLVKTQTGVARLLFFSILSSQVSHERSKTTCFSKVFHSFWVFKKVHKPRRLSQHGRRSPPPSPREEEKLDAAEVGDQTTKNIQSIIK